MSVNFILFIFYSSGSINHNNASTFNDSKTTITLTRRSRRYKVCSLLLQTAPIWQCCHIMRVCGMWYYEPNIIVTCVWMFSILVKNVIIENNGALSEQCYFESPLLTEGRELQIFKKLGRKLNRVIREIKGASVRFSLRSRNFHLVIPVCLLVYMMITGLRKSFRAWVTAFISGEFRP